MLAKDDIAKFIVKHNPKQKREELMKLSLSALVIVKVHLEIEIQQKRKTMKKILVLIFIALAVNCSAQHNHGCGHGDEEDKPSYKELPQHGGEIIDAGKYKLEVLISPMNKEEKLSVYVLKKNHKQIETKSITGKVEIRYKDGTTENIDLIALDEKLISEPKQVGSPANYCFIVVINKKEYRACYFYTGLTKN